MKQRLVTPIGLNNRLPLARMDAPTETDSSPAWLRVAENIDLSAGGFVRRRKGYSLTDGGAWHSLWSDSLDAYGVLNGDLVRVDIETLAHSVVATGINSSRVSYVRLPDGFVYWSDGQQIGRIDGNTARKAATPKPNPVPIAFSEAGSLPAGRYQVMFTEISEDGESGSTEPTVLDLADGGGIGFAGLTPSTLVYVTAPDGDIFNEVGQGSYLTLNNDGGTCNTFMLSSMPAGHSLSHFKGSLLVASGNWLYISESYRYGLFNLNRGFIPFPAPISVVVPCEDGVYVCADKTYWLPGDPLATTPVVILPFGALPNSAAFDADTVTAYWQSKDGLIIGKPGGNAAAAQEDALQFSKAASGFTWVRDQLGEKHIVTTRFGVET